MTAEDARKLVEQSPASNMKELYDSITATAVKGKRRLVWYDRLSDNQFQELVKRGFHIQVISPNYPPTTAYKINW